MNFQNVSAAKEYVLAATNRAKTAEVINSSIEYHQRMVDQAHNDKSRGLWERELEKLELWKNSDDFKNGNYPQGIDELILETIEWRAIQFAFQSVDTKRNPFKESGFFAQWYLGSIYGVFTIIGKLISKDIRDNSLRKLWDDVSPIMLGDGACTQEEIDYINQEMHRSNGRFTNTNSSVLRFRNKLIAHNEANPVVKWDEVDAEMSLLIRMWSLLVAWSSFGLYEPFRSNEQAFMGLESFFQESELSLLKNARQDYLNKAESWSKTYAHNGKLDKGRGAFSTLSAKVTAIKKLT
ncbi:hypothetical protein [Vibrio alginolyticus]|uniref:hypothetical protein n=1 Tax=Vibrio alginolyticus TaxID=663 RepID=UPI001BD6CD21|nr:hypothetical protein [Vibrio alginolyticus]MBT0115763.1 hypothetical protein [Vibrio alginolyticus]MCQ9036815.1 hypothetical protein [Vibrio alginolyticus]